MIRITMKDGGIIDLELDKAAAPITVENFEKLVREGFYDGLIFHRIIPGFMIQGGDPEGTGMGGPGWHIKGEFAANGWNNPIGHTRGVISMARAQDAHVLLRPRRSMVPLHRRAKHWLGRLHLRASEASSRR